MLFATDHAPIDVLGNRTIVPKIFKIMFLHRYNNKLQLFCHRVQQQVTVILHPPRKFQLVAALLLMAYFINYLPLTDRIKEKGKCFFTI